MEMRTLLGLFALASVVVAVITPAIVYATIKPEAFEARWSWKLPVKVVWWPPLVVVAPWWKLEEYKVLNDSIAGYSSLTVDVEGGVVKVVDGRDHVTVWAKAPDKEDALRMVTVEKLGGEYKIHAAGARVNVELGEKGPDTISLAVNGGTAYMDLSRLIKEVKVNVNAGTVKVAEAHVLEKLALEMVAGTLKAEAYLSKGSKAVVSIDAGTAKVVLHVPRDAPVCIRQHHIGACSLDIETGSLNVSCGPGAVQVEVSCTAGTLKVDVVGG